MDRPRVLLNVAMTVDGKIASATRDPGRLTGNADLQRMSELRATAGAVVVGAATVRAIDPPLQPQGGGSGGPAQVVLTTSGRIDPGARALTDARARARILATTASATVPQIAGVDVWRLGDARVDASALLGRLAELGVDRVLVEGGGETNATFVEAGLIDEVYLTIAPSLLGGRAAPTPVDGTGLKMAARLHLHLASVREVDGELFCHYLVGED